MVIPYIAMVKYFKKTRWKSSNGHNFPQMLNAHIYPSDAQVLPPGNVFDGRDVLPSVINCDNYWIHYFSPFVVLLHISLYVKFYTIKNPFLSHART